MKSLIWRVRFSLALSLFGLVVQLFTALFFSPLSFVLFVAFGVSAVSIGVVVFLWAVWRHVEEQEPEEEAS